MERTFALPMQKNLTAANNYIPALTLLRGVAALSVVFFHLLYSGFNDWPLLKSIFGFGHLGLDLFFLISGFVIPYSMYMKGYRIKQFFKFFLKRFVRIEPTYIISFLLVILMRIVYSAVNGYDYEHDWNQFLLHFLYLNQYFGYDGYAVIYWTLAIEFQFYIIAGLCVPLLMHKKKYVSIVVLALFSLASLYIHPPNNWFILNYGFLFIVGILTFQYYVGYFSLTQYIVLVSLGIAGVLETLELAVTITAVVGVLSIFFLKKEWKISSFFGDISYSLYLTHTEVAGFFIISTRPYFLSEDLHQLVSVVLAIAFGFLFYRLVELPFLKLSKRITYKENNTLF